VSARGDDSWSKQTLCGVLVDRSGRDAQQPSSLRAGQKIISHAGTVAGLLGRDWLSSPSLPVRLIWLVLPDWPTVAGSLQRRPRTRCANTGRGLDRTLEVRPMSNLPPHRRWHLGATEAGAADVPCWPRRSVPATSCCTWERSSRAACRCRGRCESGCSGCSMSWMRGVDLSAFVRTFDP
jgi:hypothetical protein